MKFVQQFPFLELSQFVSARETKYVRQFVEYILEKIHVEAVMILSPSATIETGLISRATTAGHLVDSFGECLVRVDCFCLFLFTH